MSKIYDYENQLILRLPEKLADELNQKIDQPNAKMPDIEMTPYLDHDEKGNEQIKFKFNYDNKFKSVGSLVDLPTITDTYRTMDSINLFKSNDISQMIVIHPEKVKNVTDAFQESAEIQKYYKKQDDNKKIIKYKCNSGLTPASKYIRKRFYKKRPTVPSKEIQQVESQLSEIIKDLTRQSKQVDDQIDESQAIKPKRRYRRKF